MILNAENLFENTFVLSLPFRFDRRKHIQEELSKINISYQFYDAVNGLEIELPEGNTLLPGEVGIRMSHLEMLRHAKENEWKSIFIFEDDAVFCEDPWSHIQKGLSSLPEVPAFIYFGGSHLVHPTHVDGRIYKTTALSTTHAMWINGAIFDHCIDNIERNPNLQVDMCYVQLQSVLPTYVFYPPVAWQKDDYSDIQGKFVNYTWIKNQ